MIRNVSFLTQYTNDNFIRNLNNQSRQRILRVRENVRRFHHPPKSPSIYQDIQFSIDHYLCVGTKTIQGIGTLVPLRKTEIRLLTFHPPKSEDNTNINKTNSLCFLYRRSCCRKAKENDARG